MGEYWEGFLFSFCYKCVKNSMLTVSEVQYIGGKCFFDSVPLFSFQCVRKACLLWHYTRSSGRGSLLYADVLNSY
jgi:hypothetical protein